MTRRRPVTVANLRWLRLAFAAGLGLVAGSLLFATEVQGRKRSRQPAHRCRHA